MELVDYNELLVKETKTDKPKAKRARRSKGATKAADSTTVEATEETKTDSASDSTTESAE